MQSIYSVTHPLLIFGSSPSFMSAREIRSPLNSMIRSFRRIGEQANSYMPDINLSTFSTTYFLRNLCGKSSGLLANPQFLRLGWQSASERQPGL